MGLEGILHLICHIVPIRRIYISLEEVTFPISDVLSGGVRAPKKERNKVNSEILLRIYSYRVSISLLIRFAKVSSHLSDFDARNKRLPRWKIWGKIGYL